MLWKDEILFSLTEENLKLILYKERIGLKVFFEIFELMHIFIYDLNDKKNFKHIVLLIFVKSLENGMKVINSGSSELFDMPIEKNIHLMQQIFFFLAVRKFIQ